MLAEIEEGIRLWYMENADLKELDEKRNWFQLDTTSFYKDKTIIWTNLVPSVEVHFNRNKLYYTGDTWDEVYRKVKELIR